MASYAGFDLGPVCVIVSEPNPKERQVNAYPGVDGLEVLDGGTRGGQSVARGLLEGDDLAGVAAAMSPFVTLQQTGGTATLIDSKGTTWPQVILTACRFTGPAEEGTDGTVCQTYEMEFLHLI